MPATMITFLSCYQAISEERGRQSYLHMEPGEGLVVERLDRVLLLDLAVCDLGDVLAVPRGESVQHSIVRRRPSGKLHGFWRRGLKKESYWRRHMRSQSVGTWPLLIG